MIYAKFKSISEDEFECWQCILTISFYMYLSLEVIWPFKKFKKMYGNIRTFYKMTLLQCEVRIYTPTYTPKKSVIQRWKSARWWYLFCFLSIRIHSIHFWSCIIYRFNQIWTFGRRLEYCPCFSTRTYFRLAHWSIYAHKWYTYMKWN